MIRVLISLNILALVYGIRFSAFLFGFLRFSFYYLHSFDLRLKLQMNLFKPHCYSYSTQYIDSYTLFITLLLLAPHLSFLIEQDI